jgi:hypothetical protein
MVSSPKIGQEVQLWYKDRSMPMHGKVGVVVVAGRGRPRNHGVRVGGAVVVVPAGNLRPAK